MSGGGGSERLKLVAIVGPTGSGKSQLGIDLARRLGGEVVNADVIQMYAGLDIASAKVPLSERDGVPHHLMSFLHPRQVYTVRDFFHMASACVRDITARGRLPIVVGGTMYYVQSLLRPSLLEDDEAQLLASRSERGPICDPPTLETAALAAAVAAAENLRRSQAAASSPSSPYARLCAVDPVMAQRLHPNDARKIERALQVHAATGMPYSQVLLQQRARLAAGGAAACADDCTEARTDADAAAPTAAAGGPFDCHTIWLGVSDAAVHDARLDARVDGMVARGLLREIRRLHSFLADEEEGTGVGASAVHSGVALGVDYGLDAAAVASAASKSGGAAADAAAPRAITQAPAEAARDGRGTLGDGAGRMDTPSELTLRVLREHVAAHARSLAPPVGVPPSLPAATESTAATTTAAAPDEDTGDVGGVEAAPSAPSFQGLLQAIGYKEFLPYLALLELHQPPLLRIPAETTASGAVHREEERLSEARHIAVAAAARAKALLLARAKAQRRAEAQQQAQQQARSKRRPREWATVVAGSGPVDAAAAVEGEGEAAPPPPPKRSSALRDEAAAAEVGAAAGLSMPDPLKPTGCVAEAAAALPPVEAAPPAATAELSSDAAAAHSLAAADSPPDSSAKGNGGAADAAAGAALGAALQRLRDATHRYARTQERFVRNRLARRGVPLQRLDTSAVGGDALQQPQGEGGVSAAAESIPPQGEGGVSAAAESIPPQGEGGSALTAAAAESAATGVSASRWEREVLAPAEAAVRAWLVGEAAASAGAAAVAAPLTIVEDDAARVFAWRKHSCDLCDGPAVAATRRRVFSGATEWAAHLASRGHRGRLAAAAARGEEQRVAGSPPRG